MGKFFHQPVLYLISSFLAPPFSLRGKCDRKAMLSLGRKASAVSSWHLSIPGVPCLPFQPPLSITWWLGASPGMALRAIQKGIGHLSGFHLPIVGSGSKYPQGAQDHPPRVKNRKQMLLWNRPSHPGASQDIFISQEHAPQQIMALFLYGKAFDGWLVMAKNEANP